MADSKVQMTPPSEITSSPSSPAAVIPQQEVWSVKSVISTLPTPVSINPSSPVPFFHLLERLKTTKREGWRRFGIGDGESISDHMYRMSIITMLAPPSLSSRLNIPHCTKMALVHDMAELLVGDITPVDRVSKEEKHRREATTMDFLMTKLLGKSSGTSDQAQGIRDIWQEYEDAKTLESKFVHDIDKVELLLQMIEYERSRDEGRLDLSEFAGVARRIDLEEVKVWSDEILKEREVFWKEKGTSRGLELVRTCELDGIETSFAMITGGPSSEFLQELRNR